MLNALSGAYLSLSGVDAARETAAKANGLAEALVAKIGSSAAWTLLKLDARSRRADVESAAGEFDAALSDARDAQAEALTLAGATVSASAPAGVDSPENELAVAYQRVGDVERARGDFDAARTTYQAWRDRAATLRVAQPNEMLWLRNEMFAIQRLGDLALSDGATSEASALFDDYLSRAEAFAAAKPADAIGIEALAGAHQRLGDAALASGDAETAEREYLALQTQAERLTGFDSANFRWREFVAVAWQRSARRGSRARTRSRRWRTSRLIAPSRRRLSPRTPPTPQRATTSPIPTRKSATPCARSVASPKHAPPIRPTKKRWRRWSSTIRTVRSGAVAWRSAASGSAKRWPHQGIAPAPPSNSAPA